MDAITVIKEVFGLLGIIAAILAFQCKRHNRVLAYRTANELLFGVQYVLLGAWTGMAMNLVGSIRNIIFAEEVKRGKSTRLTALIFCLFFTVAGIITWEGPKSILIISAKVISSLAYGNKNLLVMRLLVLLTCSAWLTYNIFVASYAGVACEVLTLSSIIIALFRYHIPWRRNEKESEN